MSGWCATGLEACSSTWSWAAGVARPALSRLKQGFDSPRERQRFQ
jgi:hypothetical protein